MSSTRRALLASIVITLLVGAFGGIAPVAARSEIQIRYPTTGETLSGIERFDALLPNTSLNRYGMSWQIDGRPPVEMVDAGGDIPHKESLVDVSAWTWRGAGPYTVTFVASRRNGSEITRASIRVTVAGTSTTTIATTTTAVPTTTTAQATTLTTVATTTTSTIATTTTTPTTTTAPASSADNPFLAGSMYRPPSSPAREQADAWRTSNPDGAALLDKIASQPTAVWLGDWSGDITAAVSGITSQAESQGTVPVLVAYDIPQRDCSGYSGGGAGSAAAYRSWIDGFAAGLGGVPVAVVLEPDALALLDCLSGEGKKERLDLLRYAVATLGGAGAAVYVDAGHARWHSAEDTAQRLQAVGMENARGFALNVSNFVATDETVTYGSRVSSMLGGTPFLADTSRNGLGPDSSGEWCNPPGRALGSRPAVTPAPSVDAYLWVKIPGESDGECNGGPAAGVFWAEYAVGLAERAGW